MKPAEDDSWIGRTEPSTHSERIRSALLQNPGVYRTETPPDPGMPFSRLIDAVAEPPTDIESVVSDAAGRCLAHTPGLEDENGRAVWILTSLGRIRIAGEAVTCRGAS